MEIHEIDQGKWGVCGFVAAIQAASVNRIREADLTSSYSALFPVIKLFCEAHKSLGRELLDFSKIFGDVYRYDSLAAVVSKMEQDNDMTERVGLAMTGKAVSKLCESLGFKNCDFHGFQSGSNMIGKTPPFKNTIYGLGKTKGKGNFRYGLRHWVYVNSAGEVMTWGRKGTTKELLECGYTKYTHYIPNLG